jgi:pimeloyl-ACP methyl ester carboxylesterase
MRLHFTDDGAGPVVVLLHGFTLDLTMWDAQRETLGSMYRVITPDLRGHGKSPAPDGIYPIDEMADDVIELLDELKIAEPVVLGGLSMGGYVAESIAVNYRKRLRGLMLMNTRARADTPEIAANREIQAQRIDETGDISAVVATMLPKLFAAHTREHRPDLVEKIGDVMMKSSPRGVAGSLRGMAARYDRMADLTRFTLPTLVLTGSDDILIPFEESKAMAEALPNAELVIVPESGHLTPLETPNAANSAILRFLSSLA